MELGVAGYLGTISEDAAVTYSAVVRNMHSFHDEVAVSNASDALLESGTVDDDVLAYDVVLSYFNACHVALVVKVLRYGSDYCSLMYLVALSKCGASHDAHEGVDDTVVSNDDIVFDICEGVDGYSATYFRIGTDYCFVADHIINYKFLFTNFNLFSLR